MGAGGRQCQKDGQRMIDGAGPLGTGDMRDRSEWDGSMWLEYAAGWGGGRGVTLS